MDYREISRFIPRAAAAWNTNNSMKKEDWTFDAEIQCHRGQFVIQAGFKTREEAEACANEVVERLIAQMKQIVFEATKNYLLAKE